MFLAQSEILKKADLAFQFLNLGMFWPLKYSKKSRFSGIYVVLTIFDQFIDKDYSIIQ